MNESDWEEISRKAKKDSRRITTEEFKKELSQINDKVEIIGEYTAANSKIKARCKICSHEWYVAPTTLRLGSGCRKCTGTLTIEHTQFVERLNLLQPDMIPLTEYVNMSTHVTVKCRVCGHIWSGRPLHLISKSGSTGCRKCSGRIRRTHEDFVVEMARVSPEIKIVVRFVSVNKPVFSRMHQM